MKRNSMKYRSPRNTSANTQDLMQASYGKMVQFFSMAAFTLAFAGWLNDTWFFYMIIPSGSTATRSMALFSVSESGASSRRKTATLEDV